MPTVNTKSNLRLIAIFLFWACIIVSTFAMLIELTPKTGGWPYWDKVQHIVGFGILATLGSLAYAQTKGWVCAGLGSYGALIEYFQGAFTTNRTASLGDWLADILGIAMGVAIYSIIKNMRTKNPAILSSNAG